MSHSRYTVLRDTAEHENKGWLFAPSTACAGTREVNLYTGDYSLEGLYEPKLFVIERKGRASEFAANLTQKEKWDDFRQELERMEEFAHPFLVLEFTLADVLAYPRGSGIPWPQQKKMKVRGPYFLRRLHEVQFAFKTHVIFAGTQGKDAATSLFKRACELCQV